MTKPQGVSHTKKPAKWIKCSCEHEFQESRSKALFGVSGKRLHNPAKTGYRCTVCGNAKADQ